MADSTVIPATTTAPAARRAVRMQVPDFVYPLVAILILLAIWEAVCVFFKVPLYLLPPPSKVVVGLFANSGLLLTNSWVTLQEVLLGFLLSIVFGVPMALAIVSFRPIE